MRWIALLALALATPAIAKQAPMPLPPPVPQLPPQNCAGPEYHQFDFWLGDWEVRSSDKLEEMRGGSVVESIIHGCGVRESWNPFTNLKGASLSIYDRHDRMWHQTFIDALGSRIEFQGGLKDGKMVLTGIWRGLGEPQREGVMRMTWNKLNDGWVRQVGEISYDQGKTWGAAFDFTYVPRTP